MRSKRDVRRAVSFAALAVTGIAGLSCYDPMLTDCTVRCDTSVGCPSPLRCMGGFCTSGAFCGADGGVTAQTCLSEAPSNVVLWLEASKGVSASATGEVDVWRDQSGLGNDARQELTDSRPRLTRNTIRGRPSLTFDGNVTFMWIPDAPSLEWGLGDWSVLMVARSINRTNDELPVLFQKSDMTSAQGVGLYLNPYDEDGGYGGYIGGQEITGKLILSTGPDHVDGVFHLLGMGRTGRTRWISVDGEIVASRYDSTILDVSAPGRLFSIGSNGYLVIPRWQALNGDVAAMVAMAGDTAQPDDMSRLQQCVLSLYGLPQRARDMSVRAPSDLPDLVLWLDGDSGVVDIAGGGVMWGDRSGLRNNAVVGVGHQPTYVGSESGLPATFRFNGTDQYLTLPEATGMADFTGGLTLMAVVTPDEPGAGGTVVDLASVAADRHGAISFSRGGGDGTQLVYDVYAPGAAAVEATDQISPAGERQLLEVVMQPGAPGQPDWFHCFKNGAVVGQGKSAAPDVIDRQAVLIGSSNDPAAAPFRGQIGEIVLYNRALNDNERRSVERYLLARWQL